MPGRENTRGPAPGFAGSWKDQATPAALTFYNPAEPGAKPAQFDPSL